MRVAILTMFNGLSNTYSLVNVVREQLYMLLQDNITVKMLVSEHCPDTERTGIFADERLEWRKTINSKNGKIFNWHTYTRAEDKIHDTFYEEAQLIAQDYVKELKDVDVCIMHDILYQGAHLVHNVAIRLAQKLLPNVKFLAFTHSAPQIHIDAPFPISCMFTPMPNTTLVYPTQCGLAAIAKQYSQDTSLCACVGNSIDVMTGMCDEAVDVISKSGYLSRDIIIVYPARLNMAKRFHIIAQLGGMIKRHFGKSVGIIFCEFEASDIDPDMYKFMIRDLGNKEGLSDKDIVFTSDCGYKNGVTRQTVFDLFALSNLYICPSYSESFGLTVLEAASRGNYIVLNEAVPALEEIGKCINAYFMRWSAKNFGYDTYETYNPTEKIYMLENLNNILENMENNPVIKAKTLARTRFCSQYVYEHQLRPLLYD
ncbi:MAG: glycosyltransferase [Oscillospiraceae bacterium]